MIKHTQVVTSQAYGQRMNEWLAGRTDGRTFHEFPFKRDVKIKEDIKHRHTRLIANSIYKIFVT